MKGSSLRNTRRDRCEPSGTNKRRRRGDETVGEGWIAAASLLTPATG